MIFKICNNGRAVLLTRDPVIIGESIEIVFEGIGEGYTAVFSIGDAVYYRPIKEGRCVLWRDSFVEGAIIATIVKDDEVRPSYVCDELYATCGSGAVVLSGNFLEYDKLLTELREEMDIHRADNELFKAQLMQFREEFDRIMKGYEVL